MESGGLVCGGEEAGVGWGEAGASELTVKTPGEAGQAWLGRDRALGNSKGRRPGSPDVGHVLLSEMILFHLPPWGLGRRCVFMSR